MEADDIRNKPVIKMNEDTNKLEAGFLEEGTGVFYPVSTVERDEDIREFMKSYGLSIVFHSR